MNRDPIPPSYLLMEPASSRSGDRWRRDPSDQSTPAERSTAISLKRIADMMEEDRKPQMRLMEEGEITDAERKRRLLEGLEREGAILERIASAIEARSATTAGRGPEDESAVGAAETPTPSPSVQP